MTTRQVCPAADLAWLLCPTDSAEKLLTFGAFFDDTGTNPKQKVAAFAGYVAPMAEWTGFEDEWRELLKDAKIPYFRAYDCVRCTGIFDGVSEDNCREYYARALDIITGRALVGIGVAGRRDNFAQYVFDIGGTEGVAAGPFELGAKMGMIVLADIFAGLWPGEKVSLVCEDGKAVDNQSVSEAFYELRASKTLAPLADVFAGPPDFRPKEYHYGLQAADVLAYELGLDLAVRGPLMPGDAVDYRPEFTRLSDHSGQHGGTLRLYGHHG